MLDKQMKKAKAAKEAKDPFRDFCESLYWLSKKPATPTQADVDAATFGFPCVAFKAAAVGACRFADGMKMTAARGAFHIDGEMATLEGPPPVPREDMVRIAMGTADIRFRGEFQEWQTTLRVSFNADALSPEQIANLMNLAGFGVGVGEWRPERDGGYGTRTRTPSILTLTGRCASWPMRSTRCSWPSSQLRCRCPRAGASSPATVWPCSPRWTRTASTPA